MERIIYSNYNLIDRFEEVKDYLMMEYVYEPTEDQIWDEINYEANCEFDNVIEELTNLFNNKYVIFVGHVGRWDGDYKGGKIGKFDDLFYYVTRDCDYIEFIDDNGHLFLNCSHHDGSNKFEIKILTDRGYNFSENWAYNFSKRYNYSEEELHRKIMESSDYSNLPNYWKKIMR